MNAHIIKTHRVFIILRTIILPTKTTAAQTEVALSYHRVRGLYFLAVVFVATIGCLSVGHFKLYNLLV